VAVAESMTQAIERNSLVTLVTRDLAIITLTPAKFFYDLFAMVQISAERLGKDSDLVIQSVNAWFHLGIDNTGTKTLLKIFSANFNFPIKILIWLS
jgi:hypothetical protein